MLSVTGSAPRSAMVWPQKQHWKSDCLDELAIRGKLLPSNGSRLSCGRPARRRKGVGRQSVPARAQHSASLKAITARQLQALVRQRGTLLTTAKPGEIGRAH